MEPYLKNKLKAKGLGDGAPAQQAQDRVQFPTP
jgi:hypothetical protein